MSTFGPVLNSAASAAAGTVTGPGSSTDNAIVRFDGATGQLVQNSAATLDDAGNLILTGTLLSKTAISAKTGNYTVLSTDSGAVFTNEGAGAQVIFSLPTAVSGLTFTFYVQVAQNVRALANTGDTVRLSDVVSASAGYAESAIVGAVVKLIAINATEWVAESVVNNWTVT